MVLAVKQPPPERSVMSFSMALALIIILDVALIAGLAFVMSRASLLNPHASPRDNDGGVKGAVAVPAPAPIRRASRRPQTSAV
jgi:hypothetical protein